MPILCTAQADARILLGILLQCLFVQGCSFSPASCLLCCKDLILKTQTTRSEFHQPRQPIWFLQLAVDLLEARRICDEAFYLAHKVNRNLPRAPFPIAFERLTGSRQAGILVQLTLRMANTLLGDLFPLPFVGSDIEGAPETFNHFCLQAEAYPTVNHMSL